MQTQVQAFLHWLLASSLAESPVPLHMLTLPRDQVAKTRYCAQDQQVFCIQTQKNRTLLDRFISDVTCLWRFYFLLSSYCVFIFAVCFLSQRRTSFGQVLDEFWTSFADVRCYFMMFYSSFRRREKTLQRESTLEFLSNRIYLYIYKYIYIYIYI